MNKEQLIELVSDLGEAKESVNVGDYVLFDGSQASGEYVTKCKVIGIEGDSVKLQEIRTYYLNGGEYPERKQSAVPMDYFKTPVIQHIQEGRDLFDELLAQLEEKNK